MYFYQTIQPMKENERMKQLIKPVKPVTSMKHPGDSLIKIFQIFIFKKL